MKNVRYAVQYKSVANPKGKWLEYPDNVYLGIVAAIHFGSRMKTMNPNVRVVKRFEVGKSEIEEIIEL